MVEHDSEGIHQVELPPSVQAMPDSYGQNFRPGVEGVQLVDKVARLMAWPEELTEEYVEETWRKVNFKLGHAALLDKSSREPI